MGTSDSEVIQFWDSAFSDNKAALAPCMQLEKGHNGLPTGTQSESHIVIRSDKKGVEIF